MILHTALQMAQELSYTDAETYIFDVMADNYFEKEAYKKAKDLYLEVLSRLSLKEDFSLDSEELVEISIKLAYCFTNLEQPEEAEQGFQFSIDTQLSRTNSFWDNQKCELLNSTEFDEQKRNSLALLGMAYDYYSKHIVQTNETIDKAMIYRQKALNISKIINGVYHEQTVILENDIADLYSRMNDYDNARQHLRTAIESAKEIDSNLLPLYYLNIASVYCQDNRQDMAKQFCHKSLNIARKANKDELSAKDRKFLIEKSETCIDGGRFY